MVLDYDVASRKSYLVEVRLHQLTDVETQKETFKNRKDFVLSTKSSSSLNMVLLQYISLTLKTAVLKPETLRTRADFLSHPYSFQSAT